MTKDRRECGSKQKRSYVLQEHIHSGTLELAWSYMLYFENAANPFEESQQAHTLVGLGLKAKDAIHIACAVAGECPYFVTTDDETLKRGKAILRCYCYRSGLFCPGDEPMSTDTEVRIRGLRALVEALGTVEAERFITLMLREPFDYTSWQRHLWTDRSVDEISKAAMALQSASPNKGMEPTC
jgi:hypothetical protein